MDKKPHYHGHRQRLREKLLRNADGLADYELLELILTQALPRGDVKPLAKELLNRFDSFASLLAAPASQIMEVKGVGESVVAALKITYHATSRLAAAQINNKHIINSWQELLNYCRVKIAYAKMEQFYVICLNQRNYVIDHQLLQTGTINHVTLYPREILKHALDKGATALILVHNHPSGSEQPSKGDIDFTNRLHQVLKPLDINLHDHLIITHSGHFSFRQNGLLA